MQQNVNQTENNYQICTKNNHNVKYAQNMKNAFRIKKK